MTNAYQLARAEIGTWEWAQGSNPRVVAYYRDAGHPQIKDDVVAWCAAFVGAMLTRAGARGTGTLLARDYLKWGQPVDLAEAREGDIVVFSRGNSTWQGHVGFFVRRAGTHIEVLGGNQRDQVSIARYPASALLGVRRGDLGGAPVVAPVPAKPGLLAVLLALLRRIFRRIVTCMPPSCGS